MDEPHNMLSERRQTQQTHITRLYLDELSRNNKSIGHKVDEWFPGVGHGNGINCKWAWKSLLG